jgi:hypothetical protein
LLTKANLPYVLWTVSYNTSFLLGYLVVYVLFFPDPNTHYDEAVPWTLEAINRNSLAIFLLVFFPHFNANVGKHIDWDNKSSSEHIGADERSVHDYIEYLHSIPELRCWWIACQRVEVENLTPPLHLIVFL